MKKRMIYLAALIAVPSLVFAGVQYFQLNHTYIVKAVETERVVVGHSQTKHYRLVWNDYSRKFDLRAGEHRRPLTLEEITPPQLPAPVPYTQDWAI